MSLDADRREERTNDIRRLDGKRSIWGNETSRRRGINGPLFKTLSGDSDQLTGRYHNQEFVDFDVTGTLAFTVNEFPKVTDADPALWNRMRVMPFDATFPENDAIKAELEAEIKNGMGLAVALHGLRLYKSGILERPRTPQEMTDAHAKWVERDDPNIDITEFLQEACDKWDASKGEPEQWRERLDAIHTAYSGYKSGRREHPLGMRNFREALEAAGVKVRKSTGNRQYVYGYMLTKEARNWGL
jgi:putative DNA primase/helicase